MKQEVRDVRNCRKERRRMKGRGVRAERKEGAGGQTDGWREENFLFQGASRKCMPPVSVAIRLWNVYTHTHTRR